MMYLMGPYHAVRRVLGHVRRYYNVSVEVERHQVGLHSCCSSSQLPLERSRALMGWKDT